jgi:hypothetical protein
MQTGIRCAESLMTPVISSELASQNSDLGNLLRCANVISFRRCPPHIHADRNAKSAIGSWLDAFFAMHPAY